MPSFNASFLDALQGKNSGRPPLWIMRQAGRYMPEYRALRAKYAFLDLVKNPELVAEVTQLPLKRFQLDAAILFSDILIILECVGKKVSFDEGPIIDEPLTSITSLEKHSVKDKLSFVFEAIRLLKNELTMPLLGFAGAPFTLAAYLIEGGSVGELKKTKRFFLHDPLSFHQLLKTLTDLTIDYLKEQQKAGVDAVQLFDTWAGNLTPEHYSIFIAPYNQRIVEEIPNLILFSRGCQLDQLAALKPKALSLDWTHDLQAARKKYPHLTLQGNLDPAILYAPLHVIEKEVTKLLDSMAGDPAYIFNLGHGIYPDVSLEAMGKLVETVCKRK